MKDSRVGTYGIVGLGMLLALKFSALLDFDMDVCFTAIIAGHAISRFAATILIYKEPYVQDIDKRKVKPSAMGIQLKDVFISGIIAFIPLLFFFNFFVFLTIIPVIITYFLLANYFRKWIGGHTGDCAGATQQVTETIFYLSLLIIL